MNDLIETLRRAADLTLVHGPDPVGCIRAAIYGRPDVSLPYYDTTESLLVEEATDSLQFHLNPVSLDADDDTTPDEWAVGRSVADVRAALFATADGIEAGVL
ncbi:hypothetical protein [Streptomyces niveus]|uniref:hypothetical protein n=1 Tax=Streptomyces niveus TaxID=193462 RepID=UPI0036D3A566